MGENSNIQWTNHSWNPWHGCIKVSDGCKFCYMYRDKERYGKDPTVVLRSKTKFNEPYSWKENAKVFTCSWSDFFIKEADEWRDEAWTIIKNTPNLTYQILTKRPKRIVECLPSDWGDGYDNVWLGVSVENQKNMHRAGILNNIPAKVRFLSIEPMLDLVTIYFGLIPNINWVIVGGESGNKTGKYLYRPCYIDWFYSIMHDCQRANVPIFIKQLGTHLADFLKYKDRHGGNWDEWVEDLKVRQFPNIK